MFKIQWVLGNTKLKKTKYKIIGFGIPADYEFSGGNTCPGANACKGVCYAKQGMYLTPQVRTARLRALKQTVRTTFVKYVISDIENYFNGKYNAIRIHDSGDFYSQEYLDKWKEIAKEFPKIKFYAYTKALHLDLYTNKPKNFHIIQSLGGKYDKKVDLTKPHSRIFSDHETRIKNGYVNGTESDIPALTGKIKIGLVYHGNKNMTESQRKYFKLPVVQND